eukprot:scaffold1.g5352.t1
MKVATRKRPAGQAAEEAVEPASKRSKTPGRSATHQAASTGSASPALGTDAAPKPAQATPQKAPAASLGVPKSRRGAAMLAAAGVPLPAAASPPRLSTKKEYSAHKAAQAAERPESQERGGSVAPPASQQRPRDPLLLQCLPKKFEVLVDMFAALQTVHEMMRRRGGRTTYQTMREAVEEACGRRFLMSHLAQLHHLLPEALRLEWVRLPVAKHSSRTEPHLTVSLDAAAALAVASARGGPSKGTPGLPELVLLRQRLHCQLAEHLLSSYRSFLASATEEARAQGDSAAAERLAAAPTEPPLESFVAPYPEGAADVPQRALPPRPEAPASAASPALSAQLLPPPPPLSTPRTVRAGPPPSTGRPPVHPSTMERSRLQQRRLSFGGAGGAAPGRVTKAGGGGTPLDKLVQQISGAPAAKGVASASGRGLGLEPPVPGAGAAADPPHAARAEEQEEEEQWNGSILSEEDAALLSSMPEELRRRSADGIISMGALRQLDANDAARRAFSSAEAQAARDRGLALAELPRTFGRLQRIFGLAGPRARRLDEVVARIRVGAEAFSHQQIEQQLAALAEAAPDYLELRPYGSCGTPAIWVNRGASGNAVMARLKALAEGRRQSLGGPAPAAGRQQ